MEPVAAPTEQEMQLAAWKQQYGEVFELSVKVSEKDTATCWLKPADRNVLAFALQKVAKDQMMEPGEFILKNCFIGGDERLRLTTGQAETPVQMAGALAAVQLVQVLEATVKNA